MDIRELIPEKVAVKTSAGTLYVRHQWTSDANCLESLEGIALAKEIIRLYASEQEALMDESFLSEAMAVRLNADDVKKILLIVAKNLNLKKVFEDVEVECLGNLIKDYLLKERQKQRKKYEKLHRDYAFMGAAKTADLYESMVKSEEALRRIGRPDALTREIAKLHSNDWSSRLTRVEKVEIETPPIAHSRPKDSVLGRAALQTAENSLEINQATQALAITVGELNRKMIEEIFPTWFKKIEKQQGNSLDAAEKARASLRWAMIAVYVSVAATVISILMTAGIAFWQAQVSGELDRSSTVTQAEMQALLQRQLAGQERLIEIHVDEIERLKKKEIDDAPLEK